MMRKILAELSEHDYHSTKPGVGNTRHNKKNVLLFLAIATTTTTITLSVPTIIMINAQGSSFDNNRDSSGTDQQQMGICVIGVKSPCNGNK